MSKKIKTYKYIKPKMKLDKLILDDIITNSEFCPGVDPPESKKGIPDCEINYKLDDNISDSSYG